MIDFEQKVAEWHNSATDLPIHEFLGITWEEYVNLVTKQPYSRNEEEELPEQGSL